MSIIWWPPAGGGSGPTPVGQTNATLDVSDLLLDADFVSNVSIIQKTASVNSFGKTVTSESTLATVGSVQPATAKDLQRVPDALRQSDVRKFWIKAQILTDGSGQYPSVISFGGVRFQIISCEPWLNWGAGWNVGLCVAEKPSL